MARTWLKFEVLMEIDLEENTEEVKVAVYEKLTDGCEALHVKGEAVFVKLLEKKVDYQ